MHMSLDWKDIERMAAVHMGLIHVGLGCSIVAGGAPRFPLPTYGPLLDLTNGRVWPYGLVFIVVGILLTAPSVRIIWVAHLLGIVALNLFAGLFFISMIQSTTAASTAWWAYFSLGTIHGFNLALMYVRRKQHMYPELEKSNEVDV